MKTYYDVLEVPFGADYETIRAAYRKALKKYHPDLHEGDSAAEFYSKRIIDAHAVLKDPEQRAAYDERLLHGKTQRRRLFLVTLLLSAGLACAGSLVFLYVPQGSKAVVSTAAPDFTSSTEPERISKAEISQAPAQSPERVAEAVMLERVAASEKSAVSPPAPKPFPEAEYAPARTAEPVVKTEPGPAFTQERVAMVENFPPPAATLERVVKVEIAAAHEPARAMSGRNPSSQVILSAREVGSPSVVAAFTPPVIDTEPASQAAASATAEKTAAVGKAEAAWAEIEDSADAEQVWDFIQQHPWSLEAVIAERRLRELIDTNENTESLEFLRAITIGPIAEKVQFRLDSLKALKEIVAGAIAEKGVSAPPAQTAPPTASLPVTASAPEVRQPQSEVVDPAANITPREPEKHIKTGVAALKAGNHDAALAAFDNAILLDNANAKYRLQRATVWEAKGNLDQAVADYDAAIAIDKNNSAALHRRGLLWGRRGQAERALSDLDRAIRLSFSDAKIYRDRGMIWFEMGRYNRAIADFSQALALDSNLTSAYVGRGKAFQKKGDRDTAAVNFDKASRRDSSVAKAYRDLLKVEPGKEVQMQKASQPLP